MKIKEFCNKDRMEIFNNVKLGEVFKKKNCFYMRLYMLYGRECCAASLKDGKVREFLPVETVEIVKGYFQETKE